MGKNDIHVLVTNNPKLGQIMPCLISVLVNLYVNWGKPMG